MAVSHTSASHPVATVATLRPIVFPRPASTPVFVGGVALSAQYLLSPTQAHGPALASRQLAREGKVVRGKVVAVIGSQVPSFMVSQHGEAGVTATGEKVVCKLQTQELALRNLVRWSSLISRLHLVWSCSNPT